MNFETRIHSLRRALAGPLPGDAPKLEFWPRPYPTHPTAAEEANLQHAAVLILLHEHRGEVALPLIRRTELHGDVHSAQIALPGGGREPGENDVDTALRETREELGISLAGVELLGSLSPHWIPVSGYMVAPVVAVIDRLGELRPDPVEVEATIFTSVEGLEGDGSRSTFVHPRGGAAEIPCWRLDGGVLWGATAMILAELLVLMQDSRSAA